MTKETIEEAAKKHSGIAYNRQDYEEQYYNPIGCMRYDSFIEGAKWEKEQDKEKLRRAFIEGHNVCRCITDNTEERLECFEEWYEQFKREI